MTIHELVTVLNSMDPEKDAFVAFFKTDDTAELFDIEAVHDHIHEHAKEDDDGPNDWKIESHVV